MTNEDLIRKTFVLARKGLGTTWPNPLVGAVIVKNGKIIAEGFHLKQGHDHAELDAIKNCKESMEGATIYVNLEPCCHTNKTTPPCAQRLIQEKFKKVVICNLDPNPSVNGKGAELLISHGIEVEHGILNHEGEKLNEVFFLAQRQKRPFIHFKTASTLDGMTAMPNGESQWITGEEARIHVHELRSQHQAIITGGETVRRDNPKLTVRLPNYQGPQPWRIVFTQSGLLPSTHFLFTDEFKDKTLIYTETDLAFSFPASQIVKIKTLKDAMDDLFAKKIISVFFEGGAGLATAFLKAGFIDRISLYQNPSFLGSGKSILQSLDLTSLNKRPRLHEIESRWIGEDHFLTGRLLCSQD
jgi:diaminohydroxyphosphoribosylaminopyrimidine deaminase/5-amino-6-(5-phosphoribosylamino)uracil reductase